MFKFNPIIIVLLLFISACSKKQMGQSPQYLSSLLLNDTIPCNNRQTFDSGEMHTYSIKNDAPFSVRHPCFNPNNPYQIIYVRETYDMTKREAAIIKMDLTNGKTQTLFTSLLSVLDLNWNRKGEILFSQGNDYQVYLINDDGSGLKQITHNQCYNGLPTWCYQDSLILIRQNNTRLCFYTRDGNMLDTIAGKWFPYSFDCNAFNEILLPTNTSFDSNQLVIVHKDKTINYYSFTIPSSRPNIYTTYAKFNPANNNEIFFYRYAQSNGLFKYNLSSGSLNLLMTSCTSEILSNFCVSPDGKKIITQAQIISKTPNGEGGHYVLLLMNTDGTDRKIIKLL